MVSGKSGSVGSGAGARAAACPTRKERLDLRKQRYVELRRAMWSARVRLDQDKGWSRLLLAATLGRKKKEEETRREEKETEDMMSEDRSACGRAFGDVLGGLKLKKRMLDWGGCVYEWVGPGDEEDVGDKERPGDEANVGDKERPGDATTKEAYSLDFVPWVGLNHKLHKPPELKSGAGDRWQEAYSLAEERRRWRRMGKENGVGWRKENVLTKAEETETANVNAAWAKMKALEAKLEAEELKAMSVEDAKSEICNLVAQVEAFERKAMAQEDTIEKTDEAVTAMAKRLEVRRRFIVHRWVKGLARHKARKKKKKEKDGELVKKSTTSSAQTEGEVGQEERAQKAEKSTTSSAQT